MSTVIFLGGIELLDKFGHSSPLCPVLDFLKVGLNRIINVDYVTCRAEAIGPKADVSSQKSKTDCGTYRVEKSEGGSSALREPIQRVKRFRCLAVLGFIDQSAFPMEMPSRSVRDRCCRQTGTPLPLFLFNWGYARCSPE